VIFDFLMFSLSNFATRWIVMVPEVFHVHPLSLQD